MSPEQLQSSRDVDPRSDIWSLGIILYELLTGEAPFKGNSMPELVLQIMSAPPPPIRNKRPDVRPELEAIIRKCLDKDRGKRYPTVCHLAVALVEFGPKRAKGSVERISGVMQSAGMSASALALPPSSDATAETGAPTRTGASWGTTVAKSAGGRAALGAAAAILGGALAWTVFHGPAHPKPLETAAIAAPAPVFAATPQPVIDTTPKVEAPLPSRPAAASAPVVAPLEASHVESASSRARAAAPVASQRRSVPPTVVTREAAPAPARLPPTRTAPVKAPSVKALIDDRQ